MAVLVTEETIKKPGRPKGLPKTGGRKKGVANVVTRQLKDMIMEALSEAGGVQYLVKQAHENPSVFLALLGKTLPREMTGENGGPIQIAARLVIMDSSQRN